MMSTFDDLLSRIRDRVDHPATARELQQRLRVPREKLPGLKRQLRELVATGALVRTRGGRYGLPDKMNLVVGRVQMHPRGFGFVAPEDSAGQVGDVFVAPPNLNQAMHGDRVVVRLEGHREGARAEGRIVRILERGATSLVGRYAIDDSGLGFVEPFDRQVIMDVHVLGSQDGGAKPGEMVVVELSRWPTPTRNPAGRIVEVLGNIDTPGVDVELILRKHGIPQAHGARAQAEAARLGATVRPRDLRGRQDFRELLTVTIDGADARDFDDAITLERLPNGHYWLGVHIADVAHYVREGTALDREAYERSTSVYFPERAIHMFPADLATGLCSLNPGVDRLVQSCLMEVGRRGEVVRYELHSGVIRSDARLTYLAVNAALTGEPAAGSERAVELAPFLESMQELYTRLRDRRRRRGAIDFDLREAVVVLDDAGLVEAITAAERNVAHRIIEEFMLLANETVAGHLEQAGFPTLFRVHEPPDAARVAEFEETLSTLGQALGAPTGRLRPRHFQRLLERIKGQPEERAVAFLVLRVMQKARYDAGNAGHFGLASPAYTHFTSPIRRYPDLVVHRAVREAAEQSLSARRRRELAEALPEVARYTSAMERRAEEAERELLQWKRVRFMADKVGDEFDGYVTGVAAFGLFVELIEHFVEGLVHVSTMADDYYRFVERARVLRGEASRKVYRIGDRVRVQVIRVDFERRQIDLGLVEILEAVRASETRARARPAREGSAARRGRGRARRGGRR